MEEKHFQQRVTGVSNLVICAECSVDFHVVIGIFLAEPTVVMISRFCFSLEVTIMLYMRMNSPALKYCGMPCLH